MGQLWFLKLGVGPEQLLLEQRCKPPEDEEAARTAKSCASDTWLSYISPPVLLQGKSIGPRCDCACSDLNLNSSGLTLHSPVPCSATGPSTGLAGLGSLYTGSQDNSGQEGSPCSGGDTPRSRAADGKKYRAEAGSVTGRFPLHAHSAGDLSTVLSLSPFSENAWDDIQPLTGLSSVLAPVKSKPVCQLYLM